MNPENLNGCKSETRDKIVILLKTSEEGKTTREIYNLGKQIFTGDFPADINTVRRYLNTMLKVGNVRKHGWYWYFVRSVEPYASIVQKYDILNIKLFNHQDIYVDHELAIYGIPADQEGLQEITTDLKNAHKRLQELAFNMTMGTSKELFSSFKKCVLSKNKGDFDEMVAVYMLNRWIENVFKDMGDESYELPYDYKQQGGNNHISISSNYVFRAADSLSEKYDITKEDVVTRIKDYKMNSEMSEALHKFIIEKFVDYAKARTRRPVVVFNGRRTLQLTNDYTIGD